MHLLQSCCLVLVLIAHSVAMVFKTLQNIKFTGDGVAIRKDTLFIMNRFQLQSINLSSSIPKWNVSSINYSKVKRFKDDLPSAYPAALQVHDKLYIPCCTSSSRKAIIARRQYITIYDLQLKSFLPSINSNLPSTSHVKIATGCMLYSMKQNCIYAIGVMGIKDNPYKPNNQTLIYYINNNSWSFVASTNVARYSAGCAMDTLQNNIFLFGGKTSIENHAARKTIERYSVKNNKWYLLPDSFIEPRRDFTCELFPFDGNIYCVGGENPYSFPNIWYWCGSNIVQRFNPLNYKVDFLYMNERRRNPKIIMWKDNCMLIVGSLFYIKNYDPGDSNYNVQYNQTIEYYGICPFGVSQKITSKVPTRMSTSCNTSNWQAFSKPKSVDFSHLFTSKSKSNNIDQYNNVGYRTHITCDRSSTICRIHCNGLRSCSQSVISPSHGLSELFVLCDGILSCLELKMEIRVEIDNVTVFCNDYNACDSANITLKNVPIKSIHVYCVSSSSCNSMMVNAEIHSFGTSTFYCHDILSCYSLNILFRSTQTHLQYDFDVTVVCKGDNSCDNLWLHTDSNFHVKASLLKYSSNIHIGYHQLDDINLICGNFWDNYMDVHDTIIFENDTYLINWHRNRFNSHHLPCEKVNIHYENNSGQSYLCETNYKIKILDRHDPNGYVLFSLLDDSLNGTYSSYVIICDHKLNDDILEQHDISWQMDLNFDSFSHCDEYFGNSTTSQNTLIIVDNIIHRSIVSCISDDIFLLQSPKSTLNVHTTCRQRGKHIVSMSTFFVIQYNKNKYSQISDIFGEKGLCYNNAIRLLQNYFGVLVNHNYTYTSRHLFFLAFIPFLILVWFLYKVYKYRQALTVDKALVLIVGIGKFDESKYNLSGVRANVTNLANLWGCIYQYQVIICNEESLYCTKYNIIDFIDEHKTKLDHAWFDGVIVHIISHGKKGGDFLTSDMKYINLEFITHEIKESCNDKTTIKLMFHHCCRGEEIYQQSVVKSRSNYLPCTVMVNVSNEPNDQANDISAEHSKSRGLALKKKHLSADANCAIIYGTVKGRTLSDDGHFAQCIYNSFEYNLSRRCCPFRKALYQLIVEIGIELEKETNGAEICDDD
eukprot:438609_1